MGWFQKTLYGVDLDAEQARSDDLDQKLREQNQKALARGAIDQKTYEITAAHVDAQAQNVEAEVDQAFDEGWNEGTANIRNGIADVVTSPLKLISWKLWVIGGIALFFYMGGAVFLKGRLNK